MKKLPEKISRIGLVANPEKKVARQVLREAAETLAREGLALAADAVTARLAGLALTEHPDVATLARHSDLLLVFGGDGTMLAAARAVAGQPTPILGVNIGGLGFLTAVPSGRLTEELPHIWQGDFTIEERPMIQAGGQVSGEPLAQLALNDFVISRGATSRLIELEVLVNGQPLTSYRCDGLIVCTPTGSTAYSLAAGGAIVSPDAPVLTITPICPHTLSNRSVIVSIDSTVEVRVLSQWLEVSLTADGQVQLPLHTGDRIQIARSPKTVRLVRLPDVTFFETLRQKLSWSGSHVGPPRGD